MASRHRVMAGMLLASLAESTGSVRGCVPVVVASVVLACSAPLAARSDVPLPRPLTDADFDVPIPSQVALGHLLFWDPILSGNRNISCGTCHHPRFGTSDGVSLSIGEGAIGVGPDRQIDPANAPEQRIPRNSPALFNLGAKEFTVLFHDGRIEVDPTRKNRIRTPLGEDMAEGFASLLSAQTMFPVLSQDEMAGHYSENDVSRAVRQGRIASQDGAWDIIAKRVDAIPEYRSMFEIAFSDITPERRVEFTHISDAIAAFIAWEWRADDSPFDRFLRGEDALEHDAAAGMSLFYGSANCAVCHSGSFQTDHGFHATGLPQIGPGKTARFESHARDTGRMRVTGNDDDAFAFRTPSLRNVSATSPYGHAGTHADLRDFLRFHLDPASGMDTYDIRQAILPDFDGADDLRIMSDTVEREAIKAAATIEPISLNDDELSQLIAFLETLTDEASLSGRLGIPDNVPSGLPIDR